MKTVKVPFFCPDLGEQEIAEAVRTLRSGWLTPGPRTRRFEQEFAAAVAAVRAIAVSSCTAALHLALEALGLRPGQGVLVPTMTFAATAEVVQYLGGIPILVDCDPCTTNMSIQDAARKLDQLKSTKFNELVSQRVEVVGIIPVHFTGLMMYINAI